MKNGYLNGQEEDHHAQLQMQQAQDAAHDTPSWQGRQRQPLIPEDQRGDGKRGEPQALGENSYGIDKQDRGYAAEPDLPGRPLSTREA